MILIAMVAVMLVMFAFGLVLNMLGLSGDEEFSFALYTEGWTSLIWVVVSVFLVLGAYILMFINISVVYVRLRNILDGLTPGAAAKVFD